MRKRNKRLQPLIKAFENNQIENFIEQLTPQNVGNLLNLVRLREEELTHNYHLMRESANHEIKNEFTLLSALATITEIELAQFKKLATIKQLLVTKKQQNRELKEKRILSHEESQQTPLKMAAGA